MFTPNKCGVCSGQLALALGTREQGREAGRLDPHQGRQDATGGGCLAYGESVCKLPSGLAWALLQTPFLGPQFTHLSKEATHRGLTHLQWET